MALVQKHIEDRPFCVVSYHIDENNTLRRNMVDSMISVCRNVCDDLELDYLEQYNEYIHELTMYVQSRHEGIELVRALMQNHIYPNPTDEYRAFWASIFVECGGGWAPGVFEEERALVTIFRVFWNWMDCNHEYVEQLIAEYDSGKEYHEIINKVTYELEATCYGVAERWQQAQDYPETKKDYPLDILLIGGITNGLDEEQIYYICRKLTIELLQERGIIG